MPFQLEIVSPERRAFTDEVDMVIVPGIDGQLGILPHHTRLISVLGVGELRIKKGGTEQSLLISGGFVEVRPDKVIVMADLAEHSDEIDETRAAEARKRAEAELDQAKDPVDIARVRAALQTALMRERIATRRRSGDRRQPPTFIPQIPIRTRIATIAMITRQNVRLSLRFGCPSVIGPSVSSPDGSCDSRVRRPTACASIGPWKTTDR